ncbi:MAG: cytochrome b/b6 domain-containing protein [Bdellovibrionales bacterium]|nr:cytochrome b/b6 domain-containing protein [Bdellovibrionales bacterium]
MKDEDLIIIEKHTLWTRWFHWINFPLLFLMIWSGILIYWADQAYIKIPVSVANQFSLHHRLAEGMGWHFFLMWLYALNGIAYVCYQIFSGQWRHLIPTGSTFKDSFKVIAHDLHLRKNPPPQVGKYNAAQKLAYCGAIFMGAGTLVTGLAIYKPVQLGWLVSLLGGYSTARLEHFVLMIGFILFLIIHVLQVLKAGWNNFRSMLAGYELGK